MYCYFNTEHFHLVVRHIVCTLADGGIQSFPDIESNTGLERRAYLEWVAEGNIAEEWEG